MTAARTDEDDIAALAKGGRTNVFGFLLRLAARIPFLFIAGRLYGPEALGRFAYALLIVEFVAQLASLGLRRGLAELLSRDERQHTQMIADAMLAAMVADLQPTLPNAQPRTQVLLSGGVSNSLVDDVWVYDSVNWTQHFQGTTSSYVRSGAFDALHREAEQAARAAKDALLDVKKVADELAKLERAEVVAQRAARGAGIAVDEAAAVVAAAREAAEAASRA